MLKPPKPVDVLPSIEHNGTEIICRIHHGFSRPSRGPQPGPRYIYGAVSPQGERHWRGSLSAIKKLIDEGFNMEKEENNQKQNGTA